MAHGSSTTGEELDEGVVGISGLLIPQLPQDIVIRTQRQRILEAMAASCAEKTFAAATIADIVSHASISRGTFYKHFNNKQECFYATADHFLGELKGVATMAYAGSGTSRVDALRDVLGGVLELMAARPEYTKLLVVEAPLVDPGIVRRYRSSTVVGLQDWLKPTEDATTPMASPEIAFGRAKVLVADCIAAGETEKLPSLLPELLYIALLPYVGQKAALAQAKDCR